MVLTAISCGARSLPELTCPTGQSPCSGACVTVAEDPQNCGACGTVCPQGTVCYAGACATSCGGGTTECAGNGGTYCAALASDNANCGACGASCAAGRKCSAGACAIECAPGLTACGPACVNTSNDGANCGECGSPCAGTCSKGRCTVTLVNDISVRAFDVWEGDSWADSWLGWIDLSGHIFRASFDGSEFGSIGNNDPIQETDATRTLFGFHVTGGYWLDSTFSECAIRSFDCCGNFPLVWSSSSPCNVYGKMWGDAKYLYWLAGYQTDNIRRIAYGDTSGQATVLATGNAVAAMTLDGGEIYWATLEPGTIAIWKMASDGTGATQLAASFPGDIVGPELVTNLTSVYWLNRGLTTTLQAVSKTGGAPHDVATISPGSPVQLAGGAFDAYVSTTTPDAIVRVPLLGGVPTTIVAAPDGALGEFVVRSSVYYLENGRILQTPL